MHFTLNSTRGLEANLSPSRYTLVSDGLQCQMSRAFSFLIRLYVLFLRLASGLLEKHFLNMLVRTKLLFGKLSLKIFFATFCSEILG